MTFHKVSPQCNKYTENIATVTTRVPHYSPLSPGVTPVLTSNPTLNYSQILCSYRLLLALFYCVTQAAVGVMLLLLQLLGLWVQPSHLAQGTFLHVSPLLGLSSFPDLSSVITCSLLPLLYILIALFTTVTFLLWF